MLGLNSDFGGSELLGDFVFLGIWFFSFTNISGGKFGKIDERFADGGVGVVEAII